MREMGDPGCDNDGVSPTPAQHARARRIARDLATVGFALPGTLTERMTRCGHPGCRCHADPPRLHGPYHQWTRKIGGKTVTRILSDDQLADYQPWFDNQRRLRALVAELRNPQPANRRRRPPMAALNRLHRRGRRPLNLWVITRSTRKRPAQAQT